MFLLLDDVRAKSHGKSTRNRESPDIPVDDAESRWGNNVDLSMNSFTLESQA